MDVHWQKPGVINYIQRCERKSTNKFENEVCLASDVLFQAPSSLLVTIPSEVNIFKPAHRFL